MSDLDGGRMTGDDALGRQIKTNLRGLDSFIPPAPPYAQIESPAQRSLRSRGKPAVRARQNLGATAGILAAGLIAVVVLGSGAWRPSQSTGADESPTASQISQASSDATDTPTGGATAAATDTPESSPSAAASLGVGATADSPWHVDEAYLLKLMNCTRTGGWVTAGGACGSSKDHTLPAQPALALDPDISAKVARPYAKRLAESGLLDHFQLDTTPRSRLCSAGFCGSVWGENLASPGGTGADRIADVEIFYQNEAFCRCEHYANVMNPRFHRVGIGVWAKSGFVRVVIDFYE
jgi:uncharacterized protein YkwD